MQAQIPQKLRAKVLWDAGYRAPKSMYRRGRIPERSAQRYIADFQEGNDWTRKEYTPRTKRNQSPKLVKKIIRKAQKRAPIYSTRQIAAHVGVSHTHVQNVLRDNGFTYSKITKHMVV